MSLLQPQVVAATMLRGHTHGEKVNGGHVEQWIHLIDLIVSHDKTLTRPERHLGFVAVSNVCQIKVCQHIEDQCTKSVDRIEGL